MGKKDAGPTDAELGEKRHVGFPFHAKTKDDCIAELGITSKDFWTTGLTSAEASQRLEKYGLNKLTEKEKVTLLQRIWNQVANVLVGILVFVALVAAAQAVRAGIDNDSEGVVTNSIQVGLITFVIT